MTKNPLWWLIEKSLINTGAAALKSAEWLSEQEFFSNEDDEKPQEEDGEDEDDVEDEQEENADDDIEDEDSEDAQDEETVDWDKELGLRARDQEWCDYDGPEEPEHSPNVSEKHTDKPVEEEKRNEKSLAERAAGWGARKLENAVNRLAMSGLRFITDTDWDDDPELELSYPSELWCKPPHDPDDDEDWEEPDDYDEPRPERNYDSVYDLITPPGCGEHGDYEDRDLENEGWEEDEDDEDDDEDDD